MLIITFEGGATNSPVFSHPMEAKMKKIFFKMVLVSGILFSLEFGQNAAAVENPIIPKSFTEVQHFQFNQKDAPAKNSPSVKKNGETSLNQIGDVEAAYDSYNNVWALVGVNYNGVQVQIYNDTGFGKPERKIFPLAEKCLSRMIHTPAQPGTEDYILRTQTSAEIQIPDGYPAELSRSMDMTNPNLDYYFYDPHIVYNSHTRSFLAIWIQKSDHLGEQLVGQVFRYNKGTNKIDLWEEPRVISVVGLILGDWTGKYCLVRPGNFNRIFSPSIDVTTNSNYAIVSAREYNLVENTGKFYPLIRLVPMGLQENTYHYNFDKRYLFFSDNWIRFFGEVKGVSASISYDPDTRKVNIYILYVIRSFSGNRQHMAIWKTDTNLSPDRNSWQNYPYRIFSVDVVLGCPVIKVDPIAKKALILYSTVSASNSISVRLIDSDQLVLADIPSGVFDSQAYFSDSYTNAPDPKIAISQSVCFITFHKAYKQTLDGKSLTFGYIYGKCISLRNRINVTSLYFLVSSGKPAQRYNECVVYNPAKGKMICFWGNGEIGTRSYESDCGLGNQTINYPSYNFNLQISRDPNAQSKINLAWNRYPPQTFLGRTDTPLYSIYILASNKEVNSISTSGTQASWQNIGSAREIAVILSVTDVSAPRLAILSPVWVNSNWMIVSNNYISGMGSFAGSGSSSGSGSGTRDSDRDGLTDDQENSIGTNPNNSDSDGDGLSDREEYYTYHTNPLNSDSDNDGLGDGREVNEIHTDPLSPTSLTRGPGVTATASSYYGDGNPPRGADDGTDRYAPIRAIDGDYTTAWSSNCQGDAAQNSANRFWIRIDFHRLVQISRIVLRDKLSPNENINGGVFLLSDGSQISILPPPADGSPVSLNIGARTISWIELSVPGRQGYLQGENPGLTEFEVFKN